MNKATRIHIYNDIIDVNLTDNVETYQLLSIMPDKTLDKSLVQNEIDAVVEGLVYNSIFLLLHKETSCMDDKILNIDGNVKEFSQIESSYLSKVELLISKIESLCQPTE